MGAVPRLAHCPRDASAASSRAPRPRAQQHASLLRPPNSRPAMDAALVMLHTRPTRTVRKVAAMASSQTTKSANPRAAITSARSWLTATTTMFAPWTWCLAARSNAPPNALTCRSPVKLLAATTMTHAQTTGALKALLPARSSARILRLAAALARAQTTIPAPTTLPSPARQAAPTSALIQDNNRGWQTATTETCAQTTPRR